MSRTRLPALTCLCLLFLLNRALAEDFTCLEGATNSGPAREGDVLRWCQIDAGGRLVYHGDVWRWYRNGKRKSKEFYVEGTAEGEWASWYPNGRQSSLGFITHGRKAGTWMYWNERGRLRAEVTYARAGNLWTEYYPTGKKRAAGKAVDSGKIGTWTWWDEKGKEKARCDFGAGLAELPAGPCRMIAEEIEPFGFSPPLPAITLSDSAATIRMSADAYTFPTPDGWKAGTQERSALVFYPEADSSPAFWPRIEVRIIRKGGRTFGTVVERTLARLGDNASAFTMRTVQRETLPGGRRAVTRQVSYKPQFQADSPQSVVALRTVHQTVTFVDVSGQWVIMAALACDSAAALADRVPALTRLLAPLRTPSAPAEPPPATTPPPPPETAPQEQGVLPYVFME